MKILVTGPHGFIGKYLVSVGATPLDVNVSDRDAVEDRISSICSPKDSFAVIHAAGKTDVEWCERHPKEAFTANTRSVNVILDVLEGYPNSRFIYLSSGHVFSGNKRIYRFEYSEKHRPDPVNMYGQTKFGGETVLGLYHKVDSVVVRIGKVYDVDTLSDIHNLGSDFRPPSFLHRNFIYVYNLMDVLLRVVEVESTFFPKYQYYRVLNVGNPNQNDSYSSFYNNVRSSANLPLLEPRETEIKGMVPRPYWLNMNVKKSLQLLPRNYGFHHA
jgi:nucleoside-diphosphate-sugar epimerase